MQLPELIDRIHSELPGWNWLVRSNNQSGFFANITTPNFESILISKGSTMIDASRGQGFKALGATPEEALLRSLTAALAFKPSYVEYPPMSFGTPVCRVLKVEDHPDASKLSLVTFTTSARLDDTETTFPTLVSAKLEDGSPRYKVGDWCVFLPENAILPEWLLKKMDFWDEAKGKGTLAGSKGNRVKMRRFAGFESKGALYGDIVDVDHFELDAMLITENDARIYIQYAENVQEHLGITEYVAQ